MTDLKHFNWDNWFEWLFACQFYSRLINDFHSSNWGRSHNLVKVIHHSRGNTKVHDCKPLHKLSKLLHLSTIFWLYSLEPSLARPSTALCWLLQPGEAFYATAQASMAWHWLLRPCADFYGPCTDFYGLVHFMTWCRRLRTGADFYSLAHFMTWCRLLWPGVDSYSLEHFTTWWRLLQPSADF